MCACVVSKARPLCASERFRCDRVCACGREGAGLTGAQVWLQLSGAAQLREPDAYQRYLRDHENKFSLHTQQIDLVRAAAACPGPKPTPPRPQDVRRTLPSNKYFATMDAPGIPVLRRVLVAYSWCVCSPTRPPPTLPAGGTRWWATARA